MDEIKEKVRKLGLEDNVKFLGQRNDINELYQAFDVFLLPSLYEGLPVVGVEAQATGLFCVFSDDMTKETKVLESTLFLSLNQSAKQWSNSILNKMKNFERQNKMVELSKKNFNIIEEAQKLNLRYIELYRKEK